MNHVFIIITLFYYSLDLEIHIIFTLLILFASGILYQIILIMIIIIIIIKSFIHVEMGIKRHERLKLPLTVLKYVIE